MIFVTGGTGLVGSHLLYQLARKGYKVTALLRPGRKACDIRNIFDCFTSDSQTLLEKIKWVEGDMLDPLSLHMALQEVEYVYHCAAMISFNPRDYKEMLRVNVEGTANLVNACLENGIKRLCHVSSIAALGHPEKGELIDENAKWKTSRRNSGYAISKYGGEREVWRGIEEGLNAVIVNPSVIIGAGCQLKATNRLFINMKNFLPFYTSGVNGYVDVADVVKAMMLLMESNICGERFVLNGENLSLREFFVKAADILGKSHPFIPLNPILLKSVAFIDEIRGRCTGSKPLITRENVRAAISKSYYSAEKFRKKFDYEFIPVSESLKTAFTFLEKIRRNKL